MKRCAVCDYLEGHGSHWLNQPKNSRRYISWNPTHKEYQCSECYTSIRTTKETQEVEDAIKALETPDEYDEVCEVPSALSKMPF
jgi:hypothetical protein